MKKIYTAHNVSTPYRDEMLVVPCQSAGAVEVNHPILLDGNEAVSVSAVQHQQNHHLLW